MFAGHKFTHRERARRAADCITSSVHLHAVSRSRNRRRPKISSLRAAAQQIESGMLQVRRILSARFSVINPNSFVAYNLLGICQAQAGEIEAARKSFQKAIELNPALATAHVNLGKLLIRMHEEAAAIRQFKAAIAIDPDIWSATRPPIRRSIFLGFV